MKKFFFALLAVFCFLMSSVYAHAQLDERAPGIYAIVDGESVPLVYSNGVTSVKTTSVVGFEVGQRRFTYKGADSGVTASGTFVMVIDPERKASVKTLKSYNPFIKTMTPNNVLVIPLVVDTAKGRRVYEEGKTLDGINTTVRERMDFEWEQISDNSFEIKVADLVPGEYGFIFRVAKLAEFDFSSIFGFTVVEAD